MSLEEQIAQIVALFCRLSKWQSAGARTILSLRAKWSVFDFNNNKNPNRHALFTRMFSAYRTRSAVVHGGSDADRGKELCNSSFQNMHGPCSFLGQHFRESIFGLSSIALQARPYRAAQRWESLIWNRRTARRGRKPGESVV